MHPTDRVHARQTNLAHHLGGPGINVCDRLGSTGRVAKLCRFRDRHAFEAAIKEPSMRDIVNHFASNASLPLNENFDRYALTGTTSAANWHGKVSEKLDRSKRSDSRAPSVFVYPISN